MESRRFNKLITSIIESMGYPDPGLGHCNGFTLAWIAARKNGTADKFIARCRILSEMPIDDLKHDIQTAKNKVINHEALTAHDNQMLEVNAFIDTIYLAQHSQDTAHQQIFGQNYTDQHHDIETITRYITPDAVEKRGNIATPLQQAVMFSTNEMAEYLANLKSMLEKAVASDDHCYDFAIVNYNHAIAVTYNQLLDKWFIIDSNQIDLIEKPLVLEEAASTIMTCFPKTNLKHQTDILKEIVSKIKLPAMQINIDDIIKNIDQPIERDLPQIEVALPPDTSSLCFSVTLCMTNDAVKASTHLPEVLQDFKSKQAPTKEMGERSSENGTTLAYLAARTNDANTLRQLAEQGIDINKPLEHDDSEEYLPIEARNKIVLAGRTPLEQCVYHNAIDALQVFIDNKYDINKPGVDGYTLANIASRHRNLEILQVLIDHGADLNYSSMKCSSPLVIASSQFDTPLMRKLIENKVDCTFYLDILIGMKSWKTAAFILAHLSPEDLSKTQVKKFTNWFTGNNRELLTTGFLSLKNEELASYNELARDVVSGKSALGKLLNTPPSKIRFQFSTRKIDGEKVTESVERIAKSIPEEMVQLAKKK